MQMFLRWMKGLGAGILLLAFISCANLPGSGDGTVQEGDNQEPPKTENQMPDQIHITVSGTTLPVSIVDNAATRALVEALRKSSITFTASDYGGFEKVGSLGRSLPAANSQITTQAGDVILYNGSSIVLFYGSNTWSYTRLGKIKYASLEDLKSFLKAGAGDISVKLSL